VIKKNEMLFILVMVLFLAIAGGCLDLIFSRCLSVEGTEIQLLKFLPASEASELRPTTGAPCPVLFRPPALEDSPTNIREAVKLGYHILMDTRKYASNYVGNKLSCKNCHFKAGMTEGGKNGGLSLVGIGAIYPRYEKRENYSVDLITRTNDCFERSMNGRRLPGESKEMTAIVTYYQWISKGLPIYAEIPGLGLKVVKSEHKPDPKKGRNLFDQKCTVCHGDHGQGTQIAPPLWGTESFNDGAGMHKLEVLATFARDNMPFENPDLTAEEALDVAAYVTQQPRPHFAAAGQGKR
jgi:thiosulfate dehydrogenase